MRERKLRHAVGWFIVISQTLIFFRRFTPAQWDIDDSLPLHMCRWTVWIIAWAMLTLDRRARALRAHIANPDLALRPGMLLQILLMS